MRAGRVALWTCVAALAGLAALGVAAFALEGVLEEEWVVTALIVGGHAVLAVPGLMMLWRRCAVIVSVVALVLLGVSAIAWLLAAWDVRAGPDHDDVEAIGSGALVSGLWVTQLAALGAMRLAGVLARVARLIAWGAGVMVVVIVLALVTGDWWWSYQDAIRRALGAGVVVALAGTLATPVLWRLEQRQGEDLGERTLDRGVPVEVACPRCGARTSVRANAQGRCAGCGLGLRVGVEEPRCACGYLLYGLASEVCPECGRAVPAALRWGAAEGAEESS